MKTPTAFTIEAKHRITEMNLKNVVGIIPGKSKKDEYVIFSGHYDHLGIGKPNKAWRFIFNGANDDAAGTTAVILLANYFKKQKIMNVRWFSQLYSRRNRRIWIAAFFKADGPG